MTFGIASWRGRGLQLADGICPRCTARIRRDLAAGGGTWQTRGSTPWEPPMALPAMIVMVLAVVVIILAARPLDPTPPVLEALAERRAPALLVEAELDSSRAAMADAPIAKRLDQEARPVEHRRALVLPPERVVYVHGWRVGSVPSRTQPLRQAKGLSARPGALLLDEARWPRPGLAVQAP